MAEEVRRQHVDTVSRLTLLFPAAVHLVAVIAVIRARCQQSKQLIALHNKLHMCSLYAFSSYEATATKVEALSESAAHPFHAASSKTVHFRAMVTKEH